MDPLELVVFVGIQASGKTTYYRRHMEGQYLHVSLDNWRGKDNVRYKERQAIRAGLREAAVSGGARRGVVVDNTNTTAQTRKRYFEYALEFWRQTGCKVRVLCYFFDADLESCLRRNAQRPAGPPAGTPYYVPPEAVAEFSQRLQPPSYGEGFERIDRVRILEGGEFGVETIPPGRTEP